VKGDENISYKSKAIAKIGLLKSFFFRERTVTVKPQMSDTFSTSTTFQAMK